MISKNATVSKTKKRFVSLRDRFLDLPEDWRGRLQSEMDTTHFKALDVFLSEKLKQKNVMFPTPERWFAALAAVSFDSVKVVILGQDPYHSVGQATGLCFSVGEGVKLPPSLVNIYKELATDLKTSPRTSGSLEVWAAQGVLLLNSVLTVDEGLAASHQGQGWEKFTDQVIRRLAEERTGVVFLLWGAYAQKKGAFVDRKRHLVLESAHPSPLSAYRGFFGSRPFSTINKWLTQRGDTPISW
jgi:uracil-DNA glycosylase